MALDRMRELFSGSPLQQAFDRATNDMLLGPDLALNLEICEMVNSLPDGPKEAIKHIRRRMTNSNPKVQVLALTVLEMCVKNCTDEFHSKVAAREFMDAMVKLAQTGSPLIRDKALVLIETWGEEFDKMGDTFPTFRRTYMSLKNRGVIFPPRDVDTLSPIFTPPARIPPDTTANVNPRVPDSAPTAARPQRSHSSNVRQVERDLGIVRENALFLAEMLSIHEEGENDVRKSDIVLDLVHDAKEMKRRAMALITSTEGGDDTLMYELLGVNDLLTNVLLMYEDILRGEKPRPLAPDMAAAPPTSTPATIPSTPETVPPPPSASTGVLLNLDDEDEEEKTLTDNRKGRQTTTATTATTVEVVPVDLLGDDLAQFSLQKDQEPQSKSKEPQSKDLTEGTDVDDEFAMIARRNKPGSSPPGTSPLDAPGQVHETPPRQQPQPEPSAPPPGRDPLEDEFDLLVHRATHSKPAPAMPTAEDLLLGHTPHPAKKGTRAPPVEFKKKEEMNKRNDNLFSL